MNPAQGETTAPHHEPKPCASCRGPVYWAQLLDEHGNTYRARSGRLASMPVDVDPVPNGNVVLMARGGAIVARVLRKGEVPPPGAKLRASHFATCPNASQHRRSR